MDGCRRAEMRLMTTRDSSVERTILDVGMEVNAYTLKCKASGEGAIVDAGRAGRGGFLHRLSG